MTITKEQIADYIINSPNTMVDADYEYHVIYDFEKKEFTYSDENFYDIVEVYAKADYLVEHEKELKEDDDGIDKSEIKSMMRNFIDETEDKNYKEFMQLCDYLAYKLNKEI